MGSVNSYDNLVETIHFPNGKTGETSSYLLLDVTDRGVHLPRDLGALIDLSQTNILVYSETITIDEDLIFSKPVNVGIFCCTLNIPVGKATVDVSGPESDPVPAVTLGDGTKGNPGGRAGSIAIYVESMDADLANKLTLKANGGSGGRGGDTADPVAHAGKGGTGGSGGKISFFWRSAAGSAMTALVKCSADAKPPCPWSSILDKSTLLVKETEPLVPSEAKVLEGVLARYNDYLVAATSCLGNATLLQDRFDDNDPSSVNSAISGFAQGLGMLLSSVEGPNLDDENLKLATAAANTQILKYLASLDDGTETDDDALKHSLNAATVAWYGTSKSALRRSLREVYDALNFTFGQINSACSSRCQVLPGTGGTGGHSPSLSGRSGERGDLGEGGTVTTAELSPDSEFADLSVAVAYVFPDHCQMLLNKANLLFFQNTPESDEAAVVYYNRLIDRLAFMPPLLDAVRKQTPAALVDSYNLLEYGLEVTVSSLEQLQSVYSHAKSYKNQISVGQDMFGHESSWVPRLSYDVYANDVDPILAALKTVEKAYKAAFDTRASLEDMAAGQQAAVDGVKRAKDRISLLTDENGPLTSSASVISQYSPLLALKVKEVESDLQTIASDIKRSLNVDVSSILGALSTIAMAPSAPLALAEGAKLLYDANTTVKDDTTGASVNKDYVITELGQAGATLQSVSLSYSTRRDKTLQLSDPGGLKLLSAADNIEKLYTEFKSSIPDTDGTGLKASLDDLRKLIDTRNSAVIEYNSSIELLAQAVTDRNYYAKQAEAFGDKAAKQMNPQLPSILLWLRRTRDNYAHEIMRMLNYGNRTIYFWGLTRPDDFGKPGPLLDSQNLTDGRLSLQTSFQNALSIFAGSAPSHWPTAGQYGTFFKLNFGQIFTLKQRQKSIKTKNYYHAVAVDLAPGVQDDAKNTLFPGRANIRLDRIRLWLIGVKVSANETGAYPVSVVITHLGKEAMQTGNRVTTTFQHDPVVMDFQYNSAGITTVADCSDDKVQNQQFLPNYYIGQGSPGTNSIAAIGPWATWTFEIREAENEGLDMTGLKEAYIEFGGYSSPFKVTR